MGSSSESGMIRGIVLLAGSLFMGAATMAHAEPVKLSIGADSRFSDNIKRSESGEKSDVENRIKLKISHKTDPGRCISDFNADLAYGIYANHTYDPEPYAFIDWLGSCQIAERFFWDVTNETRDVVQNNTEPNTPDNRSRRNIFSTGPRYVWGVTPVDAISLSAQYENIEFSEPEERDSEAGIGSAVWSHLFSELLTGGLNLSTEHREYDNKEKVDRNTATLFFSKEFAATTISGSLGGTWLKRRFFSTEQSFNGWVGDLRLERQINEASSFYVAASRQVTDETSEFDFLFDGVTYTIEDTSAVEVSDVRGGYTRRFSDTSTLNLSAVATRSDNLKTDSREGRVAFNADYRRPVTGQIDFTAGTRVAYIDYKDNDTQDEIIGVDVGLSCQLLSDLDLSGKIGHNRRNSDVGSREYAENWVLVSLEYQIR